LAEFQNFHIQFLSMAELDKPFLSSSLEQIHVDVEMLDFDYVNKCQDWQVLFRIFQVLKSGKEGHYPEVSIFLL
jgi:hypothetical protein